MDWAVIKESNAADEHNVTIRASEPWIRETSGGKGPWGLLSPTPHFTDEKWPKAIATSTKYRQGKKSSDSHSNERVFLGHRRTVRRKKKNCLKMSCEDVERPWMWRKAFSQSRNFTKKVSFTNLERKPTALICKASIYTRPILGRP